MLGRYLPLWILKNKFRESYKESNFVFFFFRMSGVILDIVLAMIIISFVALNDKHEYVANECETYRIICSNEIKSMGFKDGDRIMKIEDIKVERFSEILKTIYLQMPPIDVQIIRKNETRTLTLTNQDQMILIESGRIDHFAPMIDDNNSNKLVTIKQYKPGLNDIVLTAKVVFNEVNKFLIPTKQKAKIVGGFNKDNKMGRFLILSTCLLIVCIINLLPIPGLDLGDLIIAIIEKKRNFTMKPKILFILRLICLSVLFLFISLLYF